MTTSEIAFKISTRKIKKTARTVYISILKNNNSKIGLKYFYNVAFDNDTS